MNHDGAADGPLFIATGDYSTMADLDWGGEYHYIEGYRAVARNAAASADSTFDLDQYVFPVVYLYRHAVELMIKRIISRWSEPPREHDLLALWSICRPLVESTAIGHGGMSLDDVHQRLAELQGVDTKAATVFRYPPEHQETTERGRVNLKVVVDRADRLCDALDAWDTAVDEGAKPA